MDIKFYDLSLGIKAKEDDSKDEIFRGLIDTGRYFTIKADHYPTFEEAEKFIEKFFDELGVDGVYGITELSDAEVNTYFDDVGPNDWPILRKL